MVPELRVDKASRAYLEHREWLNFKHIPSGVALTQISAYILRIKSLAVYKIMEAICTAYAKSGTQWICALKCVIRFSISFGLVCISKFLYANLLSTLLSLVRTLYPVSE